MAGPEPRPHWSCGLLPNGLAQRQRRDGRDSNLIIAPLLARSISSAAEPLSATAGVSRRSS